MLEPNRIQMNVCPQVIQKLGNGTYYYNYDIREVEAEVEILDEKDSTKFETQYNFIQVLLNGQPNYKDCVRAIIRSFITIDEEFDLINSYNSYTKNLSTDSSIITDYQEYLTKLMNNKNKVEKDFGLVNK